MKVVVIDNYDSFTYNLVEAVSSAPLEGGETPTVEVLTNDVELDTVRAADPDAVLISPGPGHPANERDVGVSIPVLSQLSRSVPVLGVCLGMEAAIEVAGGTIERAPEAVHGKAATISHDGRGIFESIEQGFDGARYHSLIAGSVPPVYEVSAWTEDPYIPMAIRHRDRPIVAVQFHPESVLTAVGQALIETFLSLAARHPNKSEDRTISGVSGR